MTFFSAGTEWTVDQSPLDQIVLIHWVGGSYGNFVYRMLHAHVEGLADLDDDFSFENGSSHSIRNISYIEDLGPTVKKDSDVTLSILKDIECKYLLIRKHSPSFIPILPLKIIKKSRLNIKIVLEEKGLAAWSLIQNILKIRYPYNSYDHCLVNSVLSNDINVEKIRIVFREAVNSSHKNWFIPTNTDNFINLNLSDIFDNQKLMDFIITFSNKLGLKYKNIDRFDFEMEKFKKSQVHIDSLFRHLQRKWEVSNPIDFLLKDCYENINYQ